MVAELNMVCTERKLMLSHTYKKVKQVDAIATICVRVETLAAQEQLDRLSDAVKTKYSIVFNPIPHVDELPTDVYFHIKLKDAFKMITTHTYISLHKFKKHGLL
jgi:hypothetical protein